MRRPLSIAGMLTLSLSLLGVLSDSALAVSIAPSYVSEVSNDSSQVSVSSLGVSASASRGDLLNPASGTLNVSPSSATAGGNSGVSANNGSGNSASNLLGSFSIVINAGPTLAGNAPALAAFQRAADQWAARIRDPITVTIDADLAPLGAGILGGTSSAFVAANAAGGFDLIRNAIVADAEADDAILASLPNSVGFNALVPGATVTSIEDDMSLTKANAKALGFNVPAGADADVTLSTNFSFDFDNSNGVTAGFFDFETVVAHEIGHVLGFVSVVDTIDFAIDQGASGTIKVNPLDLFRFADNTANDPATAGEFNTFDRSLTPGVNEITDDIATEYRMSTGLTQGDARQASHWKADEFTGTTIGLMDPTLSAQQVEPITPADWRALDLIGYDIGNDSILTAPANLALGSVISGSTYSENINVNKTGVEGTTYSVATTSTLQQTSDGVIAGGVQVEIVALALQGTEPVGAFAATATVDNTAYDFFAGSDGSQDPNNVINVTASILDSSEGSFNSVADQNAININFGSVLQNSSPGDIGFDIFNLVQTASFTAGLDLDSITFNSGDAGKFSTDLAMFSNLAAGSSNAFLASFGDTSVVGSFTAQYLLGVSDQNLPGAAAGTDLIINISGTVDALASGNGEIPEPSTLVLCLLAGLGFLRRRRTGR